MADVAVLAAVATLLLTCPIMLPAGISLMLACNILLPAGVNLFLLLTSPDSVS